MDDYPELTDEQRDALEELRRDRLEELQAEREDLLLTADWGTR